MWLKMLRITLTESQMSFVCTVILCIFKAKKNDVCLIGSICFLYKSSNGLDEHLTAERLNNCFVEVEALLVADQHAFFLFH